MKNPTHIEIEQAVLHAHKEMAKLKSPAFELHFVVDSKNNAYQTKFFRISSSDSVRDNIISIKQMLGIKLDEPTSGAHVFTEKHHPSFVGVDERYRLVSKARDVVTHILSFDWVSDAVWVVDLEKAKTEVIILSFDDVTLTVGWHNELYISVDYILTMAHEQYLAQSKSVVLFEKTWKELAKAFVESMSLAPYPTSKNDFLILHPSQSDAIKKAHEAFATRVVTVLSEMLIYLSKNMDVAEKHGIAYQLDDDTHYTIQCYDGREISRADNSIWLK